MGLSRQHNLVFWVLNATARTEMNMEGVSWLIYVMICPHRHRADVEQSVHTPVEALIFEVIIRNEKLLFTCLYNPHNKYKKQCCNSIETLFETVQSEHISTAYVIGEMNINMMN